MSYIPESFYSAGLARKHPIAMEAEAEAPITELGYDTLNWGEGWQYTLPPRVDNMKWLSGGKHQVNICDRWNQNKATLAVRCLHVLRVRVCFSTNVRTSLLECWCMRGS